jgi:hypothetical protein
MGGLCTPAERWVEDRGEHYRQPEVEETVSEDGDYGRRRARAEQGEERDEHSLGYPETTQGHEGQGRHHRRHAKYHLVSP